MTPTGPIAVAEAQARAALLVEGPLTFAEVQRRFGVPAIVGLHWCIDHQPFDVQFNEKTSEFGLLEFEPEEAEGKAAKKSKAAEPEKRPRRAGKLILGTKGSQDTGSVRSSIVEPSRGLSVAPVVAAGKPVAVPVKALPTPQLPKLAPGMAKAPMRAPGAVPAGPIGAVEVAKPAKVPSVPKPVVPSAPVSKPSLPIPAVVPKPVARPVPALAPAPRPVPVPVSKVPTPKMTPKADLGVLTL